MIAAPDPVPPVDPRPPAPAESVRPLAPVAKPDPAPAAELGPSVRLSIDRDPRGDFFVYTLTDRETGRVIAQLPRDQLAALKDQDGYVAGAVVRTSA